MTAEERQKRIEDHLRKVEFASLDELSEQLDVSASTIRRDLTALESTGTVRRTHGGARLVAPDSDEFVFTNRDERQLSEKELIGQACAKLIEPNQTVIMDGGTTVFHVAKYLEPKTPHIITNSLPVANLFASHQQVEVVLSGGVIYPRLGVLVGPLAVHAFHEMQADVAIMSSGGITAGGVSNSHVLLIDIQKAMMKAARKVIFCLDSTKFGRQSLTTLCALYDIDVIVTNEGADEDLVGELRANGIEVVVAGNAAS